MKYKFNKYDWAGTQMFGIDCDEKILNNLSHFNWKSSKAQEIIDGIQSTIDTDIEYRWSNEEIMIICNKHAVFFIDLILMRAGENKKEKQDLDLTHNEFITFMTDFKKFLEDNRIDSSQPSA